MGKFTYDSSLTVDFEDRALAHLQLVIAVKLRRGESFTFSWKDDPQIGDGRTAVWIHPSVPLVFRFFGGRVPAIDRRWVDALMQTANSASGLQLVPEPLDAAAPPAP